MQRRKINYEPYKDPAKPYHVQKPIPNTEDYYEGRRYNRRGIKSFIETATLEGMVLIASDIEVNLWLEKATLKKHEKEMQKV